MSGQMTAADRIDQYVKMRDAIKLKDDEHKAKMKPAKEFLENLEGLLLLDLNNAGVDSLAGQTGTAYKLHKRSATIADGAAFRQFVIDNAEYDLADWKANAVAVAAYIEENQNVPPGVNYGTSVEVGIRRPAKTK